MERTVAALSDPAHVPASRRASRPAAAGAVLTGRPQVVAQREMQDSLNHGPKMVGQRQQLQALFGKTAQLAARPEEFPEEELLKARFAAARKPASDEDEPAQRRNDTGLPDNLKSGVEALSGISLDSVKVHYNSSRPAQLNALAYARGAEIHVAPGQEEHLPHEAWHVAQQAQGRVAPTMRMKDGTAVNDDRSLEQEADTMGAKALQLRKSEPVPAASASMAGRLHGLAVQRAVVQRALEGTDFTLALFCRVCSEVYGLHAWGDEFLAAENDGPAGIRTYAVHVHLYPAAVAEDNVTLTGHAIWNKNGGRCQQAITVTAALNGDRWVAQLALGAETIEVPNANPALKDELYERVVQELPDILADVLNEDAVLEASDGD